MYKMFYLMLWGIICLINLRSKFFLFSIEAFRIYFGIQYGRDAETSSAWLFGFLVISNSFRNLIQKRCWNEFSMTVGFLVIPNLFRNLIWKRCWNKFSMTVWFSRHCELISESNTEEMLKRVQHDCLVFSSFRIHFGI